jgi:hypothetical protein
MKGVKTVRDEDTKLIILRSNGCFEHGIVDNKKCKRGCGDAYGEAWHRLNLAGI